MAESPVDDVNPGLGVDKHWQGQRGRMFSTESSQSDQDSVPQYRAQCAATLIEHVSLLDVFSRPNVVRNTGIICTIGKLGFTPLPWNMVTMCRKNPHTF